MNSRSKGRKALSGVVRAAKHPLAVWAAVIAGLLGIRAHYSGAVERDTSKTALLRLAAHEVRTPLALARGYVDMVQSEALGSLSPAVHEALHTVDAKLGEIDELANHLVEAARLQGGQARLRMEPLDIGEVLREASERMSSLSGPEHRMVLDLPSQPVMVAGDRLRLRAVLSNLVSNAIKYSPKGGEVRCTVRAGGSSVDASVADQGIGIAPDQLQQVFRPFTRLRSGTAASTQGLGLGLFVAREIARAHHGDLFARSNDGAGTTFHLWLPALRDHAARARGPQAQPLGEGTISRRSKSVSRISPTKEWWPSEGMSTEVSYTKA